MAFGSHVIKELVIREADPVNDTPSGLVADLAVRQLQSEALLDIRVMDTDADSYCHRSVAAVISTTEEEKKRKSNTAVETRKGSFSPFIVSHGEESNICIEKNRRGVSIQMGERLWPGDGLGAGFNVFCCYTSNWSMFESVKDSVEKWQRL